MHAAGKIFVKKYLKAIRDIVAKSHGLGVRLTENCLIQQLTPEMKRLP